MQGALDKMQGEWNAEVLPFAEYPKNPELNIMGGIDDIQMILDDQIVKTQTMKTNSFIGPFEERTKAWEKSLLMLQDTLDEWMKCQQTWMYLEPIFGSEDIMKQMPVEGAMFKKVDVSWRDILKARPALLLPPPPALPSFVVLARPLPQLLGAHKHGVNRLVRVHSMIRCAV